MHQNYIQANLVLLLEHRDSCIPVVSNASCFPATIVARGIGLVLERGKQRYRCECKIKLKKYIPRADSLAKVPAGSQSACPSPCTGWTRQRASFHQTGCTPEKTKYIFWLHFIGCLICLFIRVKKLEEIIERKK